MQAKYLLIGAGRVSRHFQSYFDLLGLKYRVWTRQEPRFDLVARAQQATHVLVLISDPAIESFITENKDILQNKVVVHASGALATPLAFGAHPLMTFTADRTYDLETYKTIPFAIEKGGPEFSELMPGLANSSFAIDLEAKTLYHALCVLSGNFTVALWQKAFSDFETRLGVPREVLLPYLRQVVRNLEENPKAALTGPIARGDVATVTKHLGELEGDDFENVYRSFVRAAKIFPGMEV